MYSILAFFTVRFQKYCSSLDRFFGYVVHFVGVVYWTSVWTRSAGSSLKLLHYLYHFSWISHQPVASEVFYLISWKLYFPIKYISASRAWSRLLLRFLLLVITCVSQRSWVSRVQCSTQPHSWHFIKEIFLFQKSIYSISLFYKI